MLLLFKIGGVRCLSEMSFEFVKILGMRFLKRWRIL